MSHLFVNSEVRPGLPPGHEKVEDAGSVLHALGMLIDLLPDCKLVGTAATVAEAIDAVARLRPDVVLMNAELAGALAAIAVLRAASQPPDGAPAKAPRIVLISLYGRGERDAQASGADAYLLKDCGPRALHAALRGKGSTGLRRGIPLPHACHPPCTERRPRWD
jgi:DNA-binding NarL/FixJ family response regulator